MEAAPQASAPRPLVLRRAMLAAALLLASIISGGDAGEASKDHSSKASATRPRNALLLAGAVSQLHGGHYQKAEDLYYVSKSTLGAPYRICANTVKKHIIEFNKVLTYFT